MSRELDMKRERERLALLRELSEVNTGDLELLLRLPVAAALVDVHPETLSRRDDLPKVRIGSLVRVRAADLVAWVRANRHPRELAPIGPRRARREEQ